MIHSVDVNVTVHGKSGLMCTRTEMYFIDGDQSNSYNMCMRNLPDIYTRGLRTTCPGAEGIHIRQS